MDRHADDQLKTIKPFENLKPNPEYLKMMQRVDEFLIA